MINFRQNPDWPNALIIYVINSAEKNDFLNPKVAKNPLAKWETLIINDMSLTCAIYYPRQKNEHIWKIGIEHTYHF